MATFSGVDKDYQPWGEVEILAVIIKSNWYDWVVDIGILAVV